MKMDKTDVKRKYTSIEDALSSLPQGEQEHCIRVGEYAEELFLQACARDVYSGNNKVRDRLINQNAKYVKMAGKYICIGKALVPELYYHMRPDFTAEEVALYRKHTTDGARLAEELLEEDFREDIDSLHVIMEAIETHHERWDGEGFPHGYNKDDIPIIGRIISLASTIDMLASGKHLEKPFEYALEQIKEMSGTDFDPVLVSLVLESKAKFKKIFMKYINQSRAIPTTECFVRRRASRPFALWYRPIISPKNNRMFAAEAQMRFKGEKEWLPYSSIEHIVKRENLQNDLILYFITETCDSLRRLDACNIPVSYIAFTPMIGWYNKRGIDKQLEQILKQTNTAPKRICLVVTLEAWEKQTKTMQENLKKISQLGCQLMFSEFAIGEISIEDLKENQCTILRLRGDVGKTLDKAETTVYLTAVSNQGISILADGIEKKSHIALLGRNKISGITGVLGGDYQQEDVLVENGLISQEI